MRIREVGISGGMATSVAHTHTNSRKAKTLQVQDYETDVASVDVLRG